MWKWILGIIYAFVVVIGAVFIFREADAEQRLTYLKDHGNAYYDEGDLDSFMYEFMVATSRESYIKTPVYQAKSTTNGKVFTLSIFHTKAVTNQGVVSVLTITLSHLNITVEPINLENYLEDNNLVRIRININFDEGHIFQDYSLEGETLAITSSTTLGAHIPIEFSVGHNEPGQSLFGLSSGTTKYIDSISLEVLDYSENIKDPEVTYLAYLENTNDLETQIGIKDTLDTQTVDVPVYNNREETTTVETLVSQSFVGDATWYDIFDTYETYDPVLVEQTLLNPYQKIIVRYFLIYGGVVLVATYLLFFLKPTLRYIRRKKHEKIYEDRPQNEAIFKDE